MYAHAHVYIYIYTCTCVCLQTLILPTAIYYDLTWLMQIMSFIMCSGGEYITVNGTEILENQGFKVSWLWYDQIGLAGLCVLFLVLGYITLRLVKKEK